MSRTATRPLGSLALKVTAGSLPWQLSFASYHAKLDVVSGTVGGVKVTLAGACGAVVNGTSGPAADGSVSAIYHDGIGQPITWLTPLLALAGSPAEARIVIAETTITSHSGHGGE